MLNWGIPVYHNDVFLLGGLSDKLISHTDSEVLQLLHAGSSLLPSYTTSTHSADSKGGSKRSCGQKRRSLSGQVALCVSVMMMSPPPPSSENRGRLRLCDGGRRRRRGGRMWCGHATLDPRLQDTWGEQGWARGWEKTTQTNVLKTFCQVHQN